MDIDAESLNVMGQLAQRMVREQCLPTQIEVTEDRRQALDGADYVITSIDVGGRELRERDVAIPQQYGIYQTVADTIGPGGVFRALRTTPVLVDIARDMEALCPQALLLKLHQPDEHQHVGDWRGDEYPGGRAVPQRPRYSRAACALHGPAV